MSNLPQLPANLRQIQHYLKTAVEHDKRDPVISYYCRLYAMQKGMEIDKKSPECRTFLVSLMDYLEKVKKDSPDEAITNEVVGQAHVENYALKVFLFADNEDRAGRFNKNVVKSFYTSGMLFDVLSVFGEISEDIEKNRKYAKWKAAYIHKCLKNGETPHAGPLDDEDEEGAEGGAPAYPTGHQPGFAPSQPSFDAFPSVPSSAFQPTGDTTFPPGSSSLPPPKSNQNLNLPTPGNSFPPPAPPSTPQDGVIKKSPSVSPQIPQTTWVPPANPSAAQLNPEQFHKALKYCKYASSALQYEDSSTAITNLTKALKLLTTGSDN